MCEALYLYGVMLLLLDRRIPGVIRERMIVSYYRYKGASTLTNMEEICRLCRSTGYTRSGKRPPAYPEELFARFKLPMEIIHLIIGRLQSEDIYTHTQAFPAPQHRSIALATQSAMLYVILYFTPDVLNKKEATMREIVDKHFPDNWMVPFFMGFSVDLADAWAPYKAAQTALKNILVPKNVEAIVKKHATMVTQLNANLDKYLTEGVLIEEYVLENVRQLLHSVRECNFTLRWILLHRTTTNKKFRDLIFASVPLQDLMRLLMNTAQFEFLLKSMFKRLLDSKNQQWEECKKEATERMEELSTYFSGEKELTRVKKNANLQAWFKQIAAEIVGLDFNNAILAGRKITQLNAALDEVQEFHQIETSLQIKQFLADTKIYLQKMIRTVNVNPKVLGDLDIVSDFSYAWEIINDYTYEMHERIKKNPSIVLLLRATFLKCASILSLPLVRITESGSTDDVAVADYYSSELVKYVRTVLDIIPKSVFKVLDEIITLQTTKLKEIPTKLERKYLNNFAQLEERYTLARATHQVSVFTQGILAMNTTLMGIIKLDPRQLLEDGIRKELVRQNASAMNEYLIFPTGKLSDFEARLSELGKKLDGFRQSFEYIQDYINLYGLKIWQEEFSRIIHYNVEQECNSFLKRKIYDWQSTYQSDAIPIPIFPPSPLPGQKNSVNFMGRLAREVLRQTDPVTTTYVESLQGWYDKDSREVVGIRTFSLLHRGVGIFGLTGMDQLICFMMVRDLTDFVRLYRRTVTKPVQGFIRKLTAELEPTTQFPPNTAKLYAIAQTKTSKLWPLFLEYITKIGQSQLIRRQIANELNFSAKLESKILTCALESMNQALITDVKAHYNNPDTCPIPNNSILMDISSYLETSGINNPITKIYITSEPLDGLPLLLFLFILTQLQQLTWNARYNTLENRDPKSPLDGAPLVVGIVTLLKQFHSNHTHTFLAFLGQYVRSKISSTQINVSAKSLAVIPPDVVNVLLFLEEFCKFCHLPRSAVEAVVPSYVFDRFEHRSS